MPRTSSRSRPLHRSGRSFMELSLEPNRSGHSSSRRAASVSSHAFVAERAGDGRRRCSGMRFSASSRVGSDGTAPGTLTACAPAAAASAKPRESFTTSTPSATATASAARNASPAAVPSTTSPTLPTSPPGTGSASCRASTPVAPTTIAPRAPRVTNTRLAPWATSSRPAATASSSVDVGMRVSLASSDSFGQR